MLTLAFSVQAIAADTNAANDNLSAQLASSKILVSDQFGKILDFYPDLIANKTVIINFIFTSCTSSCPLSTMVFRQVQQKLGNKKAQLISISVDPLSDTPERLLAFSQQFHAGENWAFVTGDKDSVVKIQKILGAYAANKDQHTNMVIVGNDKLYRWNRLYGFPKTDDIVSALAELK